MVGGYLFSSELFFLLLALFQLLIMSTTKPRKTGLYRICFHGAVCSVINLCLEFYIGITAAYPWFYNKITMDVAMIFYVLFYTHVLYLILLYITSLDEEKHRNRKKLNIGYGIFLTFSMIGAMYCVCMKKFFVHRNGFFDISLFVKYLISEGLFCSVVCSVASFFNKNHLPKIVKIYLVIFVPIEIFILLVQFNHPYSFFMGATFVLPFFVFYILFHSNPFDPTSGCQNLFSFQARFYSLISKNRKFNVVFVSLPKLENTDFFSLIGNASVVKKIYAETCRKAERVCPGLNIYRLQKSTFAAIFKRKSDEQETEFLGKIEDVLRAACMQFANRVTFKMAAFHESKFIKSDTQLYKMADYLKTKFASHSESQVYVATKKDYEDFGREYKIERLLYKIRNNVNIDDEHIILYVQPIYDVKTGTFRTGEALMRLCDDDGDLIYPDEFIPLAERTGCIHALTRIILNKVCLNVARLKKTYDFDAITVNFSSSEFNDVNLHKEILQIIKSHDIPNSYIRIELTESVMFDSFDLVKSNMEILRKDGINFYLDDFGTGYSNLERIMSLPFYAIKFDKSILYKSISDNMMERLITNMIKLFVEKGFHTLCEGVENEMQSDFCIERGIEYIQGFKYAKPVPIDSFGGYLVKKMSEA